MMNVRRARVWLWAAAAAFAAGAAAVAVAAALLPVREPKVPARPRAVAAAAARDDALPPLKAFAAAWSLDLRRPLYDPPPSAAPGKIAAGPAPLAVTLTGTVVEPGHSLAVFSGAGGKVELKAVGESAGGAEVLAIRRDSAVVRHHGEPLTLRVPKPK